MNPVNKSDKSDLSEIAIRQGTAADLAAAARLQALAPEAAQWAPADYLAYDFRVASCGAAVAGFAAARVVDGAETELLNLAVEPGFRRRGIATMLLRDLVTRHPGAVFLEVRESNTGALAFYQALGFREVARRRGYYSTPPEGAVVMKLCSWYCHM
jgi:ribosomal-protein-alanine N-acetyltransferase